MNKETIGVLHPGEMGVFIAACARNSGNRVLWASAGRSANTVARAEKQNLTDVMTIEKICQECTLIISVCPPHAAENVARIVMQNGYTGIYVDANAISPQRTMKVGMDMAATGIKFVDGGIIGGPAWEGGRTYLYLAGESASLVAACFLDGTLQIYELKGPIGKASAIKMCYAAYTKGTTALLSGILATAEYFDVREVLEDQWARDWPGFSEQAERRATRVTAKAWRFAGEMEEISATFKEAGLPGEIHAGAAEVYRRMIKFKDVADLPELDEVLNALLNRGNSMMKT